MQLQQTMQSRNFHRLTLKVFLVFVFFTFNMTSAFCARVTFGYFQNQNVFSNMHFFFVSLFSKNASVSRLFSYTISSYFR